MVTHEHCGITLYAASCLRANLQVAAKVNRLNFFGTTLR